MPSSDVQVARDSIGTRQGVGARELQPRLKYHATTGLVGGFKLSYPLFV